MITTGSTSLGFSNATEVIDTSTNSTTCTNLQQYPLAVFGSMGVLNNNGKPLICGGFGSGTAFKECYFFDSNGWTATFPMITARFNAAMTRSPFSDKSQHVLVAGGGGANSSVLGSVEVLTDNGWEIFTPALPTTMFGHCMVIRSPSTVMIISGNQGGSYSGNTYTLNDFQTYWANGPPLNIPRFGHSCGKILENGKSTKFSIIVVAGHNSNGFSPLEFLDEDALSWRLGQNIPSFRYGLSLVEDLSGGIIILGGLSGSGVYSTSLYHLSNAGVSTQLELLTQKLSKGTNKC